MSNPPTAGGADLRPTVYLTNWTSNKTPGCHGSGRKHTIMVAPRRWERGCGTVEVLVPELDDLRAVQSEAITVDEYRERYQRRLASHQGSALRFLFSVAEHGRGVKNVEDGDTLCCACSRAEAAAGRCHRAWAAEYLARAGWRVILDGTEVKP